MHLCKCIRHLKYRCLRSLLPSLGRHRSLVLFLRVSVELSPCTSSILSGEIDCTQMEIELAHFGIPSVCNVRSHLRCVMPTRCNSYLCGRVNAFELACFRAALLADFCRSSSQFFLWVWLPTNTPGLPLAPENSGSATQWWTVSLCRWRCKIWVRHFPSRTNSICFPHVWLDQTDLFDTFVTKRVLCKNDIFLISENAVCDEMKGINSPVLRVEDIRKMQRSEMRMLRWMTGVSLSEKKSNEWVRSMLAIDDIGEVMRQNRLRWFGHVERRDELWCGFTSHTPRFHGARTVPNC